MIWNDRLLIEWASKDGIEPFDLACINPASIDLRWSGRWRQYLPAKVDKPGGWSKTVESALLDLQPGTLYLLDSLEFIRMPDNAAGTLCLKSSAGRKGLEHLHAGFFDPSFTGTATWEIHILIPDPLCIEKGQRLMQLVMEDCMVPERSYRETGRYNSQRGPTEAR